MPHTAKGVFLYISANKSTHLTIFPRYIIMIMKSGLHHIKIKRFFRKGKFQLHKCAVEIHLKQTISYYFLIRKQNCYRNLKHNIPGTYSLG